MSSKNVTFAATSASSPSGVGQDWLQPSPNASREVEGHAISKSDDLFLLLTEFVSLFKSPRMKKIVIVYVTAFLYGSLMLTTTSFKARPIVETTDHIVVDPNLKPFFDRFVKLMEENDIPVDYSQINAVELVPLKQGANGYYARYSKTVIIAFYFMLPTESTPKEDDELIFITLAHEIGHSQGWKHTNPKIMGLMNPYSTYDLRVVRGMGADQYIVNHFKAKLSQSKKSSRPFGLE